MFSLGVSFILFAVITRLHAQPNACSPKDPGPFLGTTPVLTIDVQEDAPLMTLGELRVHGVLGGQGADGMVFEVLPNYLFLNPEDYFNFVYKNNTNFAELKLQLDRDGPTAEMDDDLNYFSFTLKCSLAANTSNETYFDVKIFVHDVNDNSPQFGDFSTNITVNELTPVGTTVLHVEATDLDLLNNLTYTLRPRSETSRSDDMSSHFAIDPVTGDITISHPLDYEAMSEGSLTVMVQDDGSPQQSSTMMLTVHVTDGDDQGPVFVYPGCFTYLNRCLA
ncbi:protocadherin gamma-A2-like [Pomacea canaliculata]|uniref:protocadherin gamma-A2-like n=1 Tax=Pomacea canaliculata TaxID=400727 RepID=UPI000D731881|nr:protocadherin gamma-A2-like [Pomacea canaliculata]